MCGGTACSTNQTPRQGSSAELRPQPLIRAKHKGCMLQSFVAVQELEEAAKQQRKQAREAQAEKKAKREAAAAAASEAAAVKASSAAPEGPPGEHSAQVDGGLERPDVDAAEAAAADAAR